MQKMVKLTSILIVATMVLFLGLLLKEKQLLSNGLIRLHVVANSDSPSDQGIKLLVRDAVIQLGSALLVNAETPQEAKACLRDNLALLETAANDALKACGSDKQATVTLEREAFPVRHYDSFSLPSGVYDSLRVTIGAGEGRNWWCVVFPSLCIGAAAEDFHASAVSAGFSSHLRQTLSVERNYKISFFFLDCLGKLENLFHFR